MPKPRDEFRYLTGKQFKVIAEREKDVDTSEIVVVKQFPCEIRQMPDDVESRILTFTISTDGVDLEGDTIAVDGWSNLATFPETGVVLWAHCGFIPPIADPIAIWVEDNKLRSRARWLPEDFSDHDHVKFANLIYLMYDKGFMKGVSVGFKPLKYAHNEERGGWFPIDYLKQYLLEYSAVPVPANPEALHEARASGLDLSPLKTWSESVIEQSSGSSHVPVPRHIAESFYKDLSSVLSVVPAAVEPAPAENQRTAAMIEKGVISWNVAHPNGTPKAPEDEAWDGPEQVAEADVNDLKVMGAWVDSEDDDTKGAYKLPHHKAAGEHSVVWNGVKAAMGALLGARGGVDIPEDDRRGVYNHLSKHYDEFDKESPEFKGLDESENDDAEPDSLEQLLEAVNLAQADLVETLMDGVESLAKAGHVLSSANAAKLREAHAKIGEVLTKLDKQDERGRETAPVTNNADPANDGDPKEMLIFNSRAEFKEFLASVTDEIIMQTTGELPS